MHPENDLHFLLVSLFSINTWLGQVFKSVQVANDTYLSGIECPSRVIGHL